MDTATIPRQELAGTPGDCLRYAHLTATVLHSAGLRPIIQAGSMQWPIVPLAQDDGTRPTHFAYMWDPESADSIKAMLFGGGLPEIHVWVGLLDSQEIVDFSTRHFREAAERAGFTWETRDPPSFLWAGWQDWPRRVRYTPDERACRFAERLLWKLYHPDYIRERYQK